MFFTSLLNYRFFPENMLLLPSIVSELTKRRSSMREKEKGKKDHSALILLAVTTCFPLKSARSQKKKDNSYVP